MPILIYAIPVVLLFFFFSGGKKKANLNDFFVGGNRDIDEKTGGSGYGLPTITRTKADSIALALFNEMRNIIPSESKTLKLLSGISQADYILIFDSFGIKKYDAFFGQEGNFLIGSDKNLTEWLTEEINSKDGSAKLKKQFPDFF